MELKNKVVVRTIGDETMLVPVGKTLSEYNGIFTLSPSAAVAFNALVNGADKEGIINAVLDEFEVSEEQVKEDVASLLEKLEEYGII